MKRSTLKPAAAAAAVVAISAVSVFGAVAPAFAATYDIYSNPVIWETFDDTTGVVEDTYFAYNGATDLYGWTDDAFDNIGRTSISDCSDGTGSVTLVFTQVAPPVIVAGGTSVFSLTSTGNVDPANCAPYTVNATVTFQGSFVRWDYTLNGDFTNFVFAGDLGSDGDGVFVQPDDFTVLESDGDNSDPSLALQVTTSGTGLWSIPANIPNFTYTNSGSPSTLSFVAAAADYTSLTGRASADAYLASIASTLSTTSFGTRFPLFQGTDAPDFTAQSLPVGTAVGKVVPYTYDAGLYYGSDYFDNADSNETVGAFVGTMPAGLTAVVTYTADAAGTPIITVSGTPTTAGTYSVPVTFFLSEVDGDRFNPLFATLSITVAGGQTLAATGVVAAPVLVGGAGLLMAGLTMVFVNLRRRIAAL